MNTNRFFTFARRGAVLGLGALVTTIGCVPPSFVITPVATRKQLVESELWRDSRWARDKIVVVDLSGVFINGRKPQMLGEGEHTVSLLAEQLDKARRDPRVKAVVLKINSPGGTVTASDLMHNEITAFKASGKPVIAVMMDVAASGGYYVACACDEIVAHPTTITGGIGVIMQMFDVSGMMSIIGVKSDAIVSGVHKDTGSPFRPLRTEERGILQGIVNDMHRQFVAVVKAGRPQLDEEELLAATDGRVFSAPEALRLGLIDRIATLREVFASTKRLVGAKRVRVVTYHRPLAYRPNFYARVPGIPGGNVYVLNFHLPLLLGGVTPQPLYLWQPGK